MTLRRDGCGVCIILRVSTRPNASWISRRLFLPAEFTGGSSGRRGAESTTARDGKNRVSPPGVKNSSGATGRPRKTSSLR